jgi:hypothetical protein
MKPTKFNVIAECLQGVLRELGFNRRKKNWYRQRGEAVQMINLQKSNFGEQFRVGLGILFRCLSENPTPNMCDCHITEQLERLAVVSGPKTKMPWLGRISGAKTLDESVRGSIEAGNVASFDLSPQEIDEVLQSGPPILKALDLEDNTFTDDDRRFTITDAMLTIGIPFLKNCDSIAKVKRCLKADRLRGAGVDKVVYRLCRLPLP